MGYMNLYWEKTILESKMEKNTILVYQMGSNMARMSPKWWTFVPSALRDVIYIIQLLEELISIGVPIPLNTPKVFCKVFEDNVGALELAKTPRMRPRTKHIGIQYHHFRDHVESGKITIEHVSTKEQIADIFTKPLPLETFKYLRYKFCGW